MCQALPNETIDAQHGDLGTRDVLGVCSEARTLYTRDANAVPRTSPLMHIHTANAKLEHKHKLHTDPTSTMKRRYPTSSQDKCDSFAKRRSKEGYWTAVGLSQHRTRAIDAKSPRSNRDPPLTPPSFRILPEHRHHVVSSTPSTSRAQRKTTRTHNEKIGNTKIGNTLQPIQTNRTKSPASAVNTNTNERANERMNARASERMNER